MALKRSLKLKVGMVAVLLDKYILSVIDNCMNKMKPLCL